MLGVFFLFWHLIAVSENEIKTNDFILGQDLKLVHRRVNACGLTHSPSTEISDAFAQVS